MSAGSERPGMQAVFRGTKAEGGWGAVCTEYCSISPESDDTPRISARLWDEEDVANLRTMVAAVHEHDALAGVELWASGSGIAQGLEVRSVSRAPSQIASPSQHMVTPIEMTAADIVDVLELYAASAIRARDAGFDIIEVYGSQSQLPMQFLSPNYNRRTDMYGGGLEGRARFWIECLQRVRDAVNGSCSIAARISMTGLGEATEQINEILAFISLADEFVDFWSVNLGGQRNWEMDIGPSRFFATDHQAEWTKRLRTATQKPIVGVGRFTDPDIMLAVLESGRLDIIGAARPSIADPFLPRKIAEGRVDEIRECIGCNICAARWDQGAPIACTQNPTAGEEYRRGWHPERVMPATNADKDILVVGAGPAGMECAMVLGKRGINRVHLVDEGKELGGIMRWIPKLPGLAEWRRVTEYRARQIAGLRNVTHVPATHLSAHDILEYGADIVILATGARWACDGLSGTTQAPIPGVDASQPTIATPDQIMAESKPVLGDNVLVYDADGYFVGVSIAELLARADQRVTLLTPFETMAPFMAYTGEQTRQRLLLDALGVDVRTSTVAERVHDGHAVVRHTYLPDRGEEVPFDSFVVATQRVSTGVLWDALNADSSVLEEAGVEQLLRIGDCAAPRLIADAIFDGHRLGREIDAAAPAVPAPFVRERQLARPIPKT